MALAPEETPLDEAPLDGQSPLSTPDGEPVSEAPASDA